MRRFTVVVSKIRCTSYWCFLNRGLGNSNIIRCALYTEKTMGLRVTKEEEIDGLDIHEHGTNCYND
jgi:ammonia channel protein AmtB